MMYHCGNSNSRIKAGKDLFVWGFVLFLMGAIAIGDVGQVPNEAGAGRSIGATKVNSSGGVKVVPAGELIKLFKCKAEEDLKEGETFGVRDALALLASMCQKNIVPTPNVDGPVAFRSLFNVTFEEALEAILGGKFAYERKGNLIEVFPRGDETHMKYAVFSLSYISAAETQRLIEPILSEEGHVGVTSPAETGVPIGESISSGTGGGDTMSLRDTIVVYDYVENIRKAKELITAIDVRPKQVLVEATILSATLTEDTQFGIDWQSLKGVAVTGLAGIGAGAPDYLKSEGTKFGGATTKDGGLTIGLAFGDIGTFIRAVEQISDVTILANPKILAVNKQLGQVYIGDKIGYNSQTTLVEGVGSTSEVSFLDTGTKLSFRPYISTDEYIRMDIHAKNSAEKTGDVISETSTELVSNIMVKDGQMIVIGGLFQDRIDTRKTQIPVLGDLPIVGAVFRGAADQYTRKEVMVLLVPHIIEEPSETGGEARAADIQRKRFGAKESLQWVGRARLAEDRYAKAAKYYLEGDNESALRELDIALMLHPTYLEAIRLKEKIISETDPEAEKKIERKVIETIEQEDLDKWLRL
ncbi:MAG: type II secretion system protein GspD [Planctomycetota bacterium]|jgi:type II secretory pathway component GspD/PulD (secretin)